LYEEKIGRKDGEKLLRRKNEYKNIGVKANGKKGHRKKRTTETQNEKKRVGNKRIKMR